MESKIYESTIEGKKQFVDELLKPFMLALDAGWADVTYECHPNGEEVVTLVNKNSDKTKKVCVTADSIRAIARDVSSNF